MPPVRQSSFAGGEIAPGLYARTNLRRYGESVKVSRNVIPRQEGPASNRPGTIYKGLLKADGQAKRLVPFQFSSGSLANNFVLEVGVGYIRFWKNGVQMQVGGVPVEVATPYTAADLPYLKFVQRGQVMTIACKQQKIQELTWISDTSWQIADFSITRAISPPTNLVIGYAPPADATVIAKEWRWVVTAVKAVTKEESLPSGFVTATCALATNKPAEITWDPVVGAGEYNVYRGRNGKYGFVGTAVGTVFHDDGPAPVYAETPPMNRDPFPSANYYPQVATFHDQRLVTANPYNNPGGIEMSRMGESHNFDRASPPRAEDAVTFMVAGRMYEEIRSLVSMKHVLVALTNASEWTILGSEGVITQDDIVIEVQSQWGSSWVDPLVIGDTILTVQDVGSTVRELVTSAAGLNGNDLTLIAQHLFQGRKIVSWCYAHEPFRVIWAVRDDGVMLSCTYIRQQEQWAWARHDTYGGTDLFESVCSVSEANENAVYVAVNRGGTRTLEKLAPRVNLTRASGIFLDAAVTGTGSVVSGLAHLNGRQVYALCDGLVRGPFTVSGGSVNVGAAATTVHVGLPINYSVRSLDMFSSEEEIRPMKKIVKKVFFEVQDTAALKAGQRSGGTMMSWTDPANGLTTGLIEVGITADWDPSGEVVVETTDPLPFTILSLIREVSFGGD